jgi:hypothetical protein
MCKTGPKTSRSKSSRFGSSIAVGTTKVPLSNSVGLLHQTSIDEQDNP